MEARTDDDQHARIDVTVEISDLKHLEKVIKSLRGVDGVLGVERAGRARRAGRRRRQGRRSDVRSDALGQSYAGDHVDFDARVLRAAARPARSRAPGYGSEK